MTEKTITLEATGSFPFTFYIEKAQATEVEKELILEGVASTTNIDHDNERMSKEALSAMANIINERGVPLRVEHSKSENSIIGNVFEAKVDDRNQLHIKARLDKKHPVSPILHHSMRELGKKMGFSVGGLVKRAVREFAESAGKLVKTFYDVELKEVSVTPRPANYDAWAISKSIAANEVEAEKTRGMFYDEFLFSNPQLDYLQVFAKSVPEEAWRKVEASKITKNENTMTEDTETKTKATDTETADTEKAVSRAEFQVVVKGISTLAKAMEAVLSKLTDDGANDQRQPDVKKPEDESPTAKALDTDAHDQNDPTRVKPKDESPTAKTAETETDTKTKASTEGTDTDGTREKATKKEETDTYDMETVTRSISALESLTKKITGMKKMSDTETDTKTKAADTETETATKTGTDETETATKTGTETETETKTKASETETDTEKGMHPLDKFVVSVTKALEAMHEKMEKSGMTVLGFEKSIVDRIQNDPHMQEEIAKMLKLPGFKKSVSLGVPYMVTKEGRRYALSASEVGSPTIEKSRDAKEGKQTFKSVYKENFSSIREEE